MEVSYCTFEFGANIWRDLRTLSLPCDSLRDNHLLSPPYMMARWPPQQIPHLNFLGITLPILSGAEYPWHTTKISADSALDACGLVAWTFLKS